MREIKFVSYDGAYPNLCSGKLVLNINGEDHWFEYALKSGGNVRFDENWADEVTEGDWTIDFKFAKSDMWDDDYNNQFTPEEIKFIENLVNENVQHGCCGGCV